MAINLPHPYTAHTHTAYPPQLLIAGNEFTVDGAPVNRTLVEVYVDEYGQRTVRDGRLMRYEWAPKECVYCGVTSSEKNLRGGEQCAGCGAPR